MSLFQSSSGALPYSHPFVLTLLVCAMLLLICVPLARSLSRGVSGSMRKVAKTWAPMLMVFGVTGLVLAVSSAEAIVFLSMPFLTILWAILLVVIFTLHFFLYRKRSYTVLPAQRVEDPRDRYLPKPKRR